MSSDRRSCYYNTLYVVTELIEKILVGTLEVIDMGSGLLKLELKICNSVGLGWVNFGVWLSVFVGMSSDVHSPLSFYFILIDVYD